MNEQNNTGSLIYSLEALNDFLKKLINNEFYLMKEHNSLLVCVPFDSLSVHFGR